MEILGSIGTSLQPGESVTSIDFKDAHFHIPIQTQARENMHFHVQGQSYQFKALAFSLFTAPMEFMVVAKEVHQQLCNWLVRVRSCQTCLQHTQPLVALSGIRSIVNMEKSELDPKQDFDFWGFQFDLKGGKVRPTLECWQPLNTKIQKLLSRPSWWHQPQVDLFPTRFNYKLPQFVSLVQDPLARAVDSLSRPWDDLDP